MRMFSGVSSTGPLAHISACGQLAGRLDGRKRDRAACVIAATATVTYPAATRSSANMADIRTTITAVANTSLPANKRRIDNLHYTKL
jgi:hypothetical protein